jgi:hypothetical protein
MKNLIGLIFLGLTLLSCKKENLKPDYKIGSEYGGGIIVGMYDNFKTSQDPNNPNGYSYEYESTTLTIALIDTTTFNSYVDNYNPCEGYAQPGYGNGFYWYSSKYAEDYCINLVSGGYDDWRLSGFNDFNTFIDSGIDRSKYSLNRFWVVDPSREIYMSQYGWYSNMHCSYFNYVDVGDNSWSAGTQNQNSNVKAHVIPIRTEVVNRY